MEPDDFDNESPAERMKRIQRTMRAPDVGIESVAQSKNVPGVGMGYSGVLGGSRGPLSAMGAVASNPRTDGVGALVGRGALQAGPMEFSYQRVQPAMRGARGENTVGLGGRPFDPDTYFGVQASQGPGGRGYGVNVGRDGFSLSGQYNPARRNLTGSLEYSRQFAGGGPVMPSFDPMGGFTGMEGVEQEGRAPGAYEAMADRVAGAGASVGEPIRQAAKGLSDIPGTVGGYFADVSSGPDPSQRLGEDIRKFGSMFVDEATKGPVEFAKTVGSFLPGIGEAISAYDATDLYDQMKKAEAEGDVKKATSLRQIYGMAAAGALPGVGMAARIARKMKGAEDAAESGAKAAISGADEAVEASAARAADDAAKAADVGADHPAMINTRYPTGKKRIEEVEGERLIADLPSMKATPEMFENNVNLVKDYVNMPESLRAGTPDEVAENFINHVKDNLIYLHDQVPENIRSRSQLWYDGARVITDDWAKEYGVPDSAVAGALAALSPQKDWYQNVSLAKRVLDVVKGGGDNFYNGFSFSPEMQKTYESIASLNKPEYTSLFDQINRRSLGDISKLDLPDDEKAILKAMWTRLYDEAHNSKAYPIVTPEGGFGDMVKTSKGEDARVAWGSMNEIAKAIRAVEGNGDPALLNDIMGGKHKVRNFYNNILAPNSSRGDVTIDTHAVAAGLLRPLSQKSVEVAHNFKTSAPKGMAGASGSAASGIQGTYPLYAEAYRRAAQERGILPRQMQSITWEAVRGLFPDTFKTPKNMAAVDALWDEYRAGRASLDDTRKAVSDLAGGVNPPTWFRPAGAVDESVQGAGDAGVVSGSGVSGNAAGGSVSRARGGPAKEPSKESVGYAKGGSASKQDAIERAIVSFRDVAEEHGIYRPQLTNIILKATPNMPRERAALFAKNILSEDLLDLSERLVSNPKSIPLLKGLEAQIKKGKTDSLVGELRQALRARAINGE